MSHERTHVPLNKTELVRNTRCLPAINLIKKRDFKDLCEKATARGGGGGGGGGGATPIHYLYGYVPPKGVVILKLLV